MFIMCCKQVEYIFPAEFSNFAVGCPVSPCPLLACIATSVEILTSGINATSSVYKEEQAAKSAVFSPRVEPEPEARRPQLARFSVRFFLQISGFSQAGTAWPGGKGSNHQHRWNAPPWHA